MVLLDGTPQSHVYLHDPLSLGFEYMQQIAILLDAAPPAPPGPLRVTHVGGAGLTLARYVQASRPGSPQIVLEPDEQLTALVRRELPLPRDHRIRVRPQPGRSGLAELGSASADVVIVDAYAGGRVSADLTTREALEQIHRVLAAGGCAVLNLADEPGLAYARRVCAGLLQTGRPGDQVVALAAREVLNGRRFGNLLLACGTNLDVDELRRAAARAPLPPGVWGPVEVVRRFAGARPFTDTDAHRSPAAPPEGSWRRR